MNLLDVMTAAEFEEFGRRPWEEFQSQRRRAADRGIGFHLTFHDWWSIWRSSGRYRQRGPCVGQFVMARKWDIGPYAVGNVAIETTSENLHTAAQMRRSRRVHLAVGCADPSAERLSVLDQLIIEEEMNEACNY